MRGAPPKRCPSQARDTPLRRVLSTLRRCDSTSRTHTSAHYCYPAGSATPLRWPSGCDTRQPTCRGRRNCSVLQWLDGLRFVRADWIRQVCCWNRQQWRCPTRATPLGGDTVITSPTRLPSLYGGQLTKQPPRLSNSTSWDVLFGRWTTSGAWPAHG